jgi:CHAT domain-containing protein
MRRFYRGMLVENRRPAAALRAAQLEMRADPRWKSPYYWAGFTLVGDWR